MKSKISLFAAMAFFFVVSVSCDKTDPLSVRIAKVWTAKLVQQGSAVVYQNGATGNSEPGYSSYKLDLSTSPNATINEFDGNVFRGTYTLSEDEKTLTVSGLVPEPTDSGGTLTFEIVSFVNGELVIKGRDAYAKTGGTINTLTLVAQ